MENKLGRKSMQDWQEMTDALTARVYKSGFNAGYDAAKGETPDVDEMAEILIERYTDVELDTITALLHDVISHKVVKSANEQRAELIQRAREFVEEHDEDFNFHVEEDNRKILAWKLVFEKFNVRALSGSAVCASGDVFNADIGKAIALARALEVDVPKEFVDAVQPDEVVVGMKVQPIEVNTREEIGEVLEVASFRYSYPSFEDGRYASSYKITDDSNAEY